MLFRSDEGAVGVHAAVVRAGGRVLEGNGLSDDVDDVEAEVLDALVKQLK